MLQGSNARAAREVAVAVTPGGNGGVVMWGWEGASTMLIIIDQE